MEVEVEVDAGMRQLLRAVNEEIAQLERGSSVQLGADVAFVCECGRADCREAVFLPLDEFEKLRPLEGWHLLHPGHQAPGDVVLRYHEDWVVVCRTRQASALA